MRKSNENTLKEVIDQLLDQYRLRDKLNEVRIRNTWEELMGQAISKRTSEIRIKDDTLFISVSSAPLREELTFSRDRILHLMNRALEGDVIKKVVIR